jgi:uncharacterized protein (TIGR02466 family)
VVAKIYDIFPTPIVKDVFPREFTESEISFFSEIEKNVYSNYSNKTSENTFILDEPEMKDIKNICEKVINDYYKKVYQPTSDSNLYITQSWINYTEKGKEHHMHSHTNSFVSAVLYIEANKDEDVISFFKSGHQAYEIPITSANDYNVNRLYFKVDKYDIIIFPSDVIHGVPTTTNTNIRISLAFNTFIKGKIGNKKNLNYLEL